MAPCPNRDHYADLHRMIIEHEPDPTDENAAAALQDPEYTHGLTQYGAAYVSLTQDIWENHYVHRAPGKDGGIDSLPDISNLQTTSEHP